MPNETPRESLTVAEAAKKLQCSERTIYRLIQKRAIPFVKLGYRTVRLPVAALDEFIASGRPPEEGRHANSEWLRRVYKPIELPIAYAKIAEHIRRNGDQIVKCVLQFKTASGKTYQSQIDSRPPLYFIP